MPREESQVKGQRYQAAVRRWLGGVSLMGFLAEAFGDTYDASRTAATVGGVQFDLSLKLVGEHVVERVFYAECKYRARDGSLSNVMNPFVENVCRAFANSEPGQRAASEFCLLASIPMAQWSLLMRYPHKTIKEGAERGGLQLDQELVTQLVPKVHVMVLSPPIIGETWA